MFLRLPSRRISPITSSPSRTFLKPSGGSLLASLACLLSPLSRRAHIMVSVPVGELTRAVIVEVRAVLHLHYLIAQHVLLMRKLF